MNILVFYIYLLVFSLISTFLFSVGTILLSHLLKKDWIPFKTKIDPREPGPAQSKFEFKQQVKSVFLAIFVGYGLVFYIIFQGLSKLYYNVSDYSIIWFFTTLPVIILASDLYIYIGHRCLHHPFLLRKIHHVHHKSVHINVLSAYSLDISESIVYTLFLSLFIFLVPVHIFNFIAFMVITVVYNFYIHSGYEFLPIENPVFKFFNTATLHYSHHTKPNLNFGLYTNLWDRLFGTYGK